MSVSKRKIGLYSLDFREKKTGDKLDGGELESYFGRLLAYIDGDDFNNKKITVTTSNKFYYMADYVDTSIIKIRFESAKVGHRPYLIDEETGHKRDNPKGLHEGEAEITHLVAKCGEDSILIALEQRVVGVTIGQIASYFNKFIAQMEGEDKYIVEHYVIPSQGFLEYLDEFNRITVGEVYIDKQDIGSEYLNNSEFGESVKDIVELTFKSKRGSSIKRGLVRTWYALFGPERQIKRIRLLGESLDGSKIRLDTNSLSLVTNIDVNILEETGVVDSSDIFEKLASIIQND